MQIIKHGRIYKNSESVKMNSPVTDKDTVEVLNFLEELENDYRIHFEKDKARLINKAIIIISSKTLGPVEDVQRFQVPEDLKESP